ncbi:MAG: TetR/AcrR family transcriptional regulator [Cellvibrio sp.]
MNTENLTEIPVESTREKILQAAHEEMYEHGFQGLRIDAVLKKAQVAKGALYHYFPTKLALGYAVLDEVIMGFFQENWSGFLGASKNPLQALKDFFNKKCADIQSGECSNGCPLTNLIQEMSTLDEGFHRRLKIAMTTIVISVSSGLKQGQLDGIVRQDIDAVKVATFVLSSYQGIMGTAKCMQSMELAIGLFTTLNDYVDSLQANS